jgi:hypothetical protein
VGKGEWVGRSNSGTLVSDWPLQGQKAAALQARREMSAGRGNRQKRGGGGVEDKKEGTMEEIEKQRLFIMPGQSGERSHCPIGRS